MSLNWLKNRFMMFIGVVFGVVFVFGMSLISANVFADNNVMVQQVQVGVPESCSLSSSGNNSHNETIHNGEYIDDIGTSTVSVYCNDRAGFSVYAIGFTDASFGKTVLSDSSIGAQYDIETGTATSAVGGDDKSAWAMKLTPVTQGASFPFVIAGSAADSITGSSVDYSGYAEVPSKYTKVAYRTSNTDVGAGAEGSTFTTTYAAYISQQQEAGTYTGQVKYVLVNPHTNVGPAIRYYMQDFTLDLCQSMASSNPLPVYDSRDERLYYVRYINGACWMTQNLRITGTIPANQSNFSGNDINISQCDLDKTVGTCEVSSDRTSTDVPMTHDFDNASQGVLYNYAAATAGTITGSSQEAATQDICPSGWHLPTYGGGTGSADGIMNNNTYSTMFSPVGTGRFGNGVYNNANMGYWWTNTYDATYSGIVYRKNLAFWGSGALSSASNPVDQAVAIRCVKTEDEPAQTDEAYIQDFTAEMCRIRAADRAVVVHDRRDGNDYTVRYINGACWMTQNLRITGTISANYSNFTGGNFVVSQCDLDSSVGDCTEASNRSSATIPMIHDSGNSRQGVWYNFVAATAGTITGSDNTNDAVEDICPSGWHLPTYDGGPGSANGLFNSGSYSVAFSPVFSGLYINGSLYSNNSGHWWANGTVSVYGGNAYRNNISQWNSMYYLGSGSNSISTGVNLRCVRT